MRLLGQTRFWNVATREKSLGAIWIGEKADGEKRIKRKEQGDTALLQSRRVKHLPPSLPQCLYFERLVSEAADQF